jgi:hypothetical protein
MQLKHKNTQTQKTHKLYPRFVVFFLIFATKEQAKNKLHNFKS